MNLFIQSLTPNHMGTFINHPLFPILIAFDLALRGYALYKAARNNQTIWFVALLFVNSVGLLPIIYLVFFATKPQPSTATTKPSEKKPAKRAKKA